MVTNGVKSLWVEVGEKQLKNPNATECAEGELEKQGTQANNQLKTPNVTAVLQQVECQQKWSEYQQAAGFLKIKNGGLTRPKGGKGACKHLTKSILTQLDISSAR